MAFAVTASAYYGSAVLVAWAGGNAESEVTVYRSASVVADPSAATWTDDQKVGTVTSSGAGAGSIIDSTSATGTYYYAYDEEAGEWAGTSSGVTFPSNRLDGTYSRVDLNKVDLWQVFVDAQNSSAGRAAIKPFPLKNGKHVTLIAVCSDEVCTDAQLGTLFSGFPGYQIIASGQAIVVEGKTPSMSGSVQIKYA